MAHKNLPSADGELYYNCWGSAIAGIEGREIRKGVGIEHPVSFDYILEKQYTSIDPKDAKFGETVLRFTTNQPYSQSSFDSFLKSGLLSRDPNASGGALHGAVFYGRSQDGPTYIYTKNGWELPPMIMKLSDLENNPYYDYGSVRGMNGSSGYYNKN